MTQYALMGAYEGGEPEALRHYDTMTEAVLAVERYLPILGPGWNLWVDCVRGEP